jgi:hypothetical protein
MDQFLKMYLFKLLDLKVIIQRIISAYKGMDVSNERNSDSQRLCWGLRILSLTG